MDEKKVSSEVKKALEETANRSSGFSLEMKSRKFLKQVNLSNGPSEMVLIEGDLGRIKHATFFEDKVLVIEGRHGTLRIEFPFQVLPLRKYDTQIHGDVWW